VKRSPSTDPALIPVHAAPELTRAQLRRFGFLLGGMFALVFGLALPGLFGRAWPLWPWIVCAALAVVAAAAPAALGPMHRAWMRFGAVLGKINTYVLLAAAFAVMIVPCAVALRLVRRDAMRRRRDPRATTYREASRAPASDHMEKPY
jgi:Saxitoxin biosynthesis operon protein SxtJ